MSRDHLDDELLHRHFDGELEPSEQGEVRQHLSDCASCNARLRGLGRLQSLIRMASEDAASDADFHGMFARIEEAARAPETQPEREVQTRTETRTETKLLKPNVQARARWFRPAVMSTAGAIAAAAAALLMISRPEPADESYDDDDDGSLAALETSRSEITHVDFGPNAGAIFDIAYDDGSSTPVVWIDDDDDAEE
jgi:anti-sigma factor RsiW